MESEDYKEALALALQGEGLAFDLPQVPFPGGDIQLLKNVVERLRSIRLSIPGFEINYMWKKEGEFPARFFIKCKSPLAYYVVGQSVAFEIASLKSPDLS